jgi:tetratricopeptide (TPR) repeat protein
MCQDATTPADTPEALVRGLLRRAQRELARATTSDDSLGRSARLLREGHHEEATDGLEALVQSDDAPAPAYYFLGLCRLLVGRHEDAAASFSEAIDRGCRPPEVVQALGDALFLLERYDEAVSAYDVVLTRHASAEAYARARPSPIWVVKTRPSPHSRNPCASSSPRSPRWTALATSRSSLSAAPSTSLPWPESETPRS